ncbi:putative ABC transporter ATP-binding protein YbbL [Paenibacillus konkukensis]|uniref:ABC transporter ATP-binding protein YbbL n=1 Tax=Paenibacillus konkukensis TaxID=2020716 RepID=A0ABY4RJQ8_9BACL|nr:ATP-binding cassette domain-containing protein [Paenibacillus konkukensis]UQZ81859.1 putative ABC transporter ATP-binding protein YbbL [Paenibacillus konkukensis]
MSTELILDMNGLSKRIAALGEERVLFSGVTARLEQPAVIALLGLSGQGKSTLLRIIGLLDAASEGSIRYRGRKPEEWTSQEWRKKVCYVAQHAVMLPGSVEDNLRAVSILHKQPFDRALASQLLRDCGLEHLDLGKRASDLSGGEKQRVALVRSLLLRPDILLLDEITASLDLHSKQAVERLLASWHRQEAASMIWVTHDLKQARQNSHKVWFMAEHTLLENMDTELFFQRPDSEAARKFLQIP